MVNFLGETFMLIAIFCTFLATIRLSFRGIPITPEKTLSRFLTHENWCYSLFLILPTCIGEFARGELSALPWIAYKQAYLEHGFIDALLSLSFVLVADLWLFWTPAQLFRARLNDEQQEKAKFARLTNLLVGLILITPKNPPYVIVETLLNWFHS